MSGSGRKTRDPELTLAKQASEPGGGPGSAPDWGARPQPQAVRCSPAEWAWYCFRTRWRRLDEAAEREEEERAKILSAPWPDQRKTRPPPRKPLRLRAGAALADTSRRQMQGHRDRSASPAEISEALRRTGGAVVPAARALGMSEQGLIRRLVLRR